jgi:hypothetical protein
MHVISIFTRIKTLSQRISDAEWSGIECEGEKTELRNLTEQANRGECWFPLF